MKLLYSFKDIISPEPNSDLDEIGNLRERTLRVLLFSASIIGLLAFFLVLPSRMARGETIFVAILSASILILLAMTFIYGLSYRLRASLMLFLLYLIGISTLLETGLSGSGRVFMLSFVLVSGILFGLRVGIQSLAISLVSFLGVGALMNTGLLPVPPIELQATSGIIREWLNSGAVYLLLGTITITALGILVNGLSSSLSKQRELSQALSDQTARLEEHVQQRTKDLTRETYTVQLRATQLQTVADVARAIASLQDIQTFLSTITHLISERFGFYHVGIFLVDDAGEFAVLKAANSEGGQRMLARNHKLRVGQVGLVGHAASRSTARIATDVGVNAEFFNNPDLPYTRSEMALPLKVGNRVIGVLDVQSNESEAFSDDDISLFSVLADQVAIAIENNRLYSETRASLEEARAIHRRYLRQEWVQEVAERGQRTFLYNQDGIFKLDSIELPELEDAMRKGQIAILDPHDMQANNDQSSKRSALAVPIKIRDQVIGVIDLQEHNDKHQWTKEEITVAQSVADQVALALENTRLFEQTIRRAERERKVLEITSKIRSNNDPNVMIRTAIDELRIALQASDAQVIIRNPIQPTPEQSSG